MNPRTNLPIGFRFHPTDEELVVHYLARKIYGFPSPSSAIPEFEVFQTDPWSFPGDVGERRYFFSKKMTEGNENRFRRGNAGSGSWKSFGKEKVIMGFKNTQVVGTKKTLIFCERKRPHSQRRTTRWFLYEYGFAGSPCLPISIQTSSAVMEDWVVYRLLMKRRRPRRSGAAHDRPYNDESLNATRLCTVDIVAGDDGYGPPQPCSFSCPYGITDVCSGCQDEEDLPPLPSPPLPPIVRF